MFPKPDLAAFVRRRFVWLTWAVLLVILAFAARARFIWPGPPVVDPDTWGYFHPALSKLNGTGFVHTNGRNFVYPAFLYVLLAVTGTLRAIPVVQHLLGLASGVLMWVCWRQWRAWFTDSRLPAWADAALGLGLVAFFLQSASEISHEHTVRPEGIFPFFALLDLTFLLAFLRAWFVARQPRRAAAWAGGGVFVALLLYQLKPSFGLALVAAVAPVLAAALVPWRQPARPRQLLAVGTLAAFVAGMVLFMLPERHLARDDLMSTLFLPETLFTIHADIIADQMNADVRGHVSTPFDPGLLAQASADLALELPRSAARPIKPYPSLGFNPDYLMYNSSFCAWFSLRQTPPQMAAFEYYYFKRAWTHLPGRMLAKVGRQLRTFYSFHCTTFWPGSTLRIDKQYRKSSDAFGYPGYQRELLRYPPTRAYLAEARQLGRSGLLFPQWPLMIYANVAASVTAFPLLLIFLAELAVVGGVRAGWCDAPGVARLLTPGWVLLMFYGFLFGNTFTIAFVHSLDMDRYCLNLLVYYAFALVGTLAWLAEFGLALYDRHPPKV